ncbi:hypothetical protein GCM10009304_05780 [Pseudomonas matsuisoli]|uniref:Uncharacterized protein n=1 Tax=Pseudomonas matsuisoli TaxID=1515666 RepID=A0A917PLB2_9PSED|nr:hypothetical protein GCM10009304_05780 [Pseudomonas matsuisoli]
MLEVNLERTAFEMPSPDMPAKVGLPGKGAYYAVTEGENATRYARTPAIPPSRTLGRKHHYADGVPKTDLAFRVVTNDRSGSLLLSHPLNAHTLWCDSATSHEGLADRSKRLSEYAPNVSKNYPSFRRGNMSHHAPPEHISYTHLARQMGA